MPNCIAIHYHIFTSELGLVLVGESVRGICFLQFGDSSAKLIEQLKEHVPDNDFIPLSDPTSSRIAQLQKTITNAIQGFAVERIPIDPIGSTFQKVVWEHLRSIPVGVVRSYSEVAQAIGAPQATRAVARACASNSIALLIPCHRVVRSDGSLGGFRWGLERKRALLLAEQEAHRVPRDSETTRASR
ncbi:MAG: hypothetical protein RL518_1547 [Pseudomonadota bacterium]|jgi:AraC family transcriptional regulator of adaptative response/methylated-DNA-[protein]-cysteine methyltransferase